MSEAESRNQRLRAERDEHLARADAFRAGRLTSIDPESNARWHEAHAAEIDARLAQAATADPGELTSTPTAPAVPHADQSLYRPFTATGFVLGDEDLVGGLNAIQLEAGGRGTRITNVSATQFIKYGIVATNPVHDMLIADCQIGPGVLHDPVAEAAGTKPKAEATVRLYGDDLKLIRSTIAGTHPGKAPVRIGAGRGKIIDHITVRSRLATEHHACVAIYAHTNRQQATPDETITDAVLTNLDLDAPLQIGPNTRDVFVANLNLPKHTKWPVILQGADRHRDESGHAEHQHPKRVWLPRWTKGRVLAIEGAELGEVSYH